MLNVKPGVLMHGIMTWRITGAFQNGTAFDAVLVEGNFPGKFWWESLDEDGDGATVTVPEDTPVRHPHWTEISKAVWGPTVLPSREREELALSRTYRGWRN